MPSYLEQYLPWSFGSQPACGLMSRLGFQSPGTARQPSLRSVRKVLLARRRRGTGVNGIIAERHA
eukprot:6228759-Alexandrium_andersonii.AAC.1